jgi:hypothetical protein
MGGVEPGAGARERLASPGAQHPSRLAGVAAKVPGTSFANPEPRFNPSITSGGPETEDLASLCVHGLDLSWKVSVPTEVFPPRTLRVVVGELRRERAQALGRAAPEDCPRSTLAEETVPHLGQGE